MRWLVDEGLPKVLVDRLIQRGDTVIEPGRVRQRTLQGVLKRKSGHKQ